MNLLGNLTKKHFYLLAGWLLINILQAFFTDLHIDESYYWMYSKHLDWGYFDHPPMIAFFIFLGDSIMHNELGVRLFTVLLSTFTMAILMNELNEKKDLFFLSLFMLSFPLIHLYIGGFLALPDAPLVFFSLLFYLVYRKFAEDPNLKLALVLALLAAAMIYSKYHSFVALGLIFLSNIKLIKNKYFWVIIFGTLILLTPHILWQIDHHFPTFKYHLKDRRKPLQLNTVFNNITSQLLVAGPLTGLLVFYSLTKFKTKDNPFNRAILFSILGFYALFFVMSFWNRIEAHWTSVIIPLLMISTYPIISTNPVLKKWFIRLSLPIIVLFFVFRFYLAANFIPNVGGIKIMYYNKLATANEIKKLAKGNKVASFNNFEFPATYEFYTGDPAIHMATPDYRFCQFDLWNEEDAGEGDSLFVVIPDRMDPTDLITLPNGKRVKTMISPKFQSLKLLTINKTQVKHTPNKLLINVTLTNNADHPIVFDHPSKPVIGFMQFKKEISSRPLFQITEKKQILPDEQISFNYEIPLTLIDTSHVFVIYTATMERNRGNMLAINLAE